MDETEQQILHDRLLAGDPVAPADTCAALLPLLAERLRRVFPRACPHLIQEAAEAALLEYVKKPNCFSTPGHLFHAARCDLSNLLRREAKHSRGRKPFVELDALAGKHTSEGLDAVIRDEDRQGAFDAAGDMKPVLELMLDGQRATPVYAEALGVAHLPLAEQERYVKRAKDRVVKRIQRKGGDHGAA